MNRFKNILFVADTSSKTCPALERAVTLAKINGASLTVVDVIAEVDCESNIQERFGISINTLLYENQLESLSTLVSPYQSSVEMIYTKVLIGTVFAEIIRAVIENGYDLVIKALHPPANLSERLLGSTDLHLLRKCPCPVWIDRPGKNIPYKRVLAAVDPLGDKELALRILQLSKSLAEREHANFEVMHAWHLEGESLLRNGRSRFPKTEVDQLESEQKEHHMTKLDEILKDFELSTNDDNVHIVKGNATSQILEFGKTADLIVMGTLGRVGVPGFFIGNTAEDVIQMVHSSILAVKPDGFVSPIT